MGQLFVDVIKGNIPEVCPLDDAIISDCVSHIGNMAIRTGRKITWNPLKGELEDDQEATSWFIREMRKPYTI
jgi:glucose-fructose oxidoreductase